MPDAYVDIDCWCQGRNPGCLNCAGTGTVRRPACGRCRGTGRSEGTACLDCRGQRWREVDLL